MKIWIDCEFNEFGGDLISMALVAEDGREFYDVLECKNPGPWVAKNVMPFLKFQKYLFKFLNELVSIHLIANWPEDTQQPPSKDGGMRLRPPRLKVGETSVRMIAPVAVSSAGIRAVGPGRFETST